jgi:hypothetical protein
MLRLRIRDQYFNAYHMLIMLILNEKNFQIIIIYMFYDFLLIGENASQPEFSSM